MTKKFTDYSLVLVDFKSVVQTDRKISLKEYCLSHSHSHSGMKNWMLHNGYTTTSCTHKMNSIITCCLGQF